MKISILASAKNDLKGGFLFYEKQQVGLGRYFLSALRADIDSLQFFQVFTLSMPINFIGCYHDVSIRDLLSGDWRFG